MAKADYFLKLDGIKGESKDAEHVDEIELLSMSFGVASGGIVGPGGGTNRPGKVQDIVVTKITDRSSTALMQFAVNGKVIKKGRITLRKAGEPEQAAAGYGLNMAYAVFRRAFPSESAFRAAEPNAQHQFLESLDTMQRGMDQQTGTAWGFRLFWMYARLMMESDPNVALAHARELEALGAKGRRLGDGSVTQ